MKVNFAHNVYDRPKTLQRTIEIERSLFPDCNIFVAYNNLDVEKDLLQINGIHLTYFSEKTHKIGCVNGAYYSIHGALFGDPDIIIFSHDDVYISNPDIVKENIMNIIHHGYDFVGRVPKNLPDIGTKYVMMEAMFFSNSAVKCIYDNFVPFKNEQDIERDLRGSISPEVNMNNLLVSNLPSRAIKRIFYDHGNDSKEYNETLNKTLGYTHQNIGDRGWKE